MPIPTDSPIALYNSSRFALLLNSTSVPPKVPANSMRCVSCTFPLTVFFVLLRRAFENLLAARQWVGVFVFDKRGASAQHHQLRDPCRTQFIGCFNSVCSLSYRLNIFFRRADFYLSFAIWTKCYCIPDAHFTFLLQRNNKMDFKVVRAILCFEGSITSAELTYSISSL